MNEFLSTVPFPAIFSAMIGGGILAMYAVAALIDFAIWLKRKTTKQ